MEMSGGSVVWILDADTGQFSKAMLSAERQAQDTAANVEGSLSKTSSALSNFGSSIGRVGWDLFTTGAGLASAALSTLVVQGIRTADYMETTRIAMSGLTGSIEDGNKAMQIAQKFWENNPFNRLDVVPAVKQLIQFGRTTDQVSEDLKLLGDISLSTGTPISELALYFARASGAGRAMTEDLEIMSMRGVPIYKKLVDVVSNSGSVYAQTARESLGLAKGAEVTTGAIREMASKSQISFELFEEAMRAAVNPDAMKEYEQTLSRQLDRLKGSFSILAGEVGGYRFENGKLIVEQDGLTRSFTRLAEAFATGLRSEEFRESMNRLGKTLVPLIDYIAEKAPVIMAAFGSALEFISENTAVLLPILGGALVMFGQLGAGLPGIGGVIGNLSSNVRNLFGAFTNLAKANPLIAGFIALFAVGLYQAYTTNEEFRKSVSRLFDALIDLFNAVLPGIMVLIDAFVQLASSDAFISLLHAFVDVLVLIVENLAKLPPGVFTALAGGFILLKVAGPVAGSVKALGTAISGISGVMKAVGGGFDTFRLGMMGVKGATGIAGKAINIVGLAFGKIISIVKVGLPLAFQVASKAIMAVPVWGWIIAAIAGVVAGFIWLWNNVDGFREFWINAWDTIKEAVSAAGEWIAGVWQNITDGANEASSWLTTTWSNAVQSIQDFFNGLGIFFSELWTSISEIFIAGWTAIWGFLSPILEFIKNLFIIVFGSIYILIAQTLIAIYTTISTVLTTVWTFIYGILTQVWTFISGVFTAIWGVISTIFSAIWTTIHTTATSIWNTIVAVFTAIWNTISSIMSAIWGVITTIWNAIWTTITTIVQWIWDRLVNAFNFYRSIITTVMGAIWGVISSVWSTISSFIGGIVNGIKNTVSSNFNAAKTLATNAFNGLRDAVGGAIQQTKAKVGEVIEGIKNLFSGAGTWLFESGKAIMQGLADGIASMAGAVKDKAEDVMAQVRDLMPFSPAKEGPFSGKGWTLYSGRSMIEGLAEGIADSRRYATDTALSVAKSIRQKLNEGTKNMQLGVDSDITGVNGLIKLTADNASYEDGNSSVTNTYNITLPNVENAQDFAREFKRAMAGRG